VVKLIPRPRPRSRRVQAFVLTNARLMAGVSLEATKVTRFGI
jgi:hypothetical protein